MLALFGGGWDPPVYWDKMTPDEARELLFGLPLTLGQEPPAGPTLNNPSPHDARKVSRHNFDGLLGQLVSHFMEREIGCLPFKLKYVYDGGENRALPHVDLTKLLWLLSVVAPSWADIVFFGTHNKLTMKVSRRSVSFSLSLDPEQRLPGSIQPALSQPRLFDVIRTGFKQGSDAVPPGSDEAARRFRFKLEYNLGYETSFSLFTVGSGGGKLSQYGSPGEPEGKGGWDSGGGVYY